MDYDTEEEAKLALNELQGKSLGFCPLIKMECQRDCICYYEGKIGRVYKKFRAIGPSCGNVLNCGEINVV